MAEDHREQAAKGRRITGICRLPRSRIAWSVVFAMLIAGAPVIAAAEQWEEVPRFRASSVLPPELRQGPGWTVEEDVGSDGINYRYLLRSDAGELSVISTELLRVRVREMAALAQMEQIKRTNIYGEALKKSATSPLRFAEGLVTSPGETVTGAARGVGQMFSNIGHAMFGSPSDQEEGVAKAALGVAVAKRAFAKQFGVDPYSTNEPMQSRLNELAWANAAGGLTVGAAFGAIGGSASAVLRGTKMAGGAGALVYDNSPDQLKKLNAAKLAAMGVSKSAVSVFLDHPKFSPTNKTFIVAALDRMQGVAHRGIVIDDAVAARTESDAFQWQLLVEMLAAYHKAVAPIVRMTSIGARPAAVTKGGALVLVVPCDYFLWTEPLDSQVKREAPSPIMPKGIARKEIWFSGQVSPLARSVLQDRRWVVSDQTASRLLPQ
jgi:hypothetical protein